MAKALPCLLVVEDEPAVRDLIVAFLKLGGHQKIVTAGNAEEALFYLFKDAALNIQLAVVDLVLPNASGLALSRAIVIATVIASITIAATGLLAHRYDLVAADNSANGFMYRIDRLTGAVQFCGPQGCTDVTHQEK